MSLIDLTTQAQAPQTGGLALQSSAVTSSLTGLHTLEFDTLNTGVNLLTGWETSKDTMSEVKLEFLTKDQAINYAKKNDGTSYSYSDLRVTNNTDIHFFERKDLDILNFEEISIGDYILTGGESAAQVLVEGCIRLIP